MKHLEKHQRVHAGFINNLLTERASDRRCSYVPSEKNVANLGTKPLDPNQFAMELRRFGVKRLHEFEDDKHQHLL